MRTRARPTRAYNPWSQKWTNGEVGQAQLGQEELFRRWHEARIEVEGLKYDVRRLVGGIHFARSILKRVHDRRGRIPDLRKVLHAVIDSLSEDNPKLRGVDGLGPCPLRQYHDDRVDKGEPKPEKEVPDAEPVGRADGDHGPDVADPGPGADSGDHVDVDRQDQDAKEG